MPSFVSICIPVHEYSNLKQEWIPLVWIFWVLGSWNFSTTVQAPHPPSAQPTLVAAQMISWCYTTLCPSPLSLPLVLCHRCIPNDLYYSSWVESILEGAEGVE
eukprot:gene7455-biopygen14181